MNLFGALRERLRLHWRDKLCAALQELGVPAQMVERGRPEEKFPPWNSLGVIDLASVTIRWCNITADEGYWGAGTHYGIPDPKIGPTFPKIRIVTVRVTKFPGFGKVIDLRWKGKDFALGILPRLTDDVSLAQPIIDSHDLKIQAYPKHGCYLLTIKSPFAPDKMLWDCYQTIAGHLLATPSVSLIQGR